MNIVDDKITQFINYTYICGLVDGIVIRLVTKNPHIPHEELRQEVMNTILPLKESIQNRLEDSPSIEEVIEDSCKDLDDLRSNLILKERLDRARKQYKDYLGGL